MKKGIKRLILLLISLLVCLFIAEVTLRFFGHGVTHVTRGALHCQNNDTGWACQPNLDARYRVPGCFDVAITCNSRGLRDKERSIEKPDGKKRIVVLGDSFIWGYGVNNKNMFSSVVEESLTDTEVINLGVCGYSTVQELIRLEMEGLLYNPDLVMLVFCRNDLEDNLDIKGGGRPVVADNNGTFEIINRPVKKKWKAPVKQWLRHHSRLFCSLEYVTQVRRVMKKREQKRKTLMAVMQDGASMSETKRKDSGLKFSLLEIYSNPTPDIDYAWKVQEHLILRIKEMSLSKKAKLMVVYVAHIECMDKEIFAKLIGSRAEDKSKLDLDWDRPAERLGAICARNEIQFMDLTPAFREHPEPLSLFFERNIHWSAKGHQLAAETVANKLKTYAK
ncbi:hypothetical protein ACFLS1_01175 [Verrucomicrobiota bacterium]